MLHNCLNELKNNEDKGVKETVILIEKIIEEYYNSEHDEAYFGHAVAHLIHKEGLI